MLEITNDWSMKVTRPFGRIYTNRDGGYLEGSVITPNGIVSVYSQTGDRMEKATELAAFANGRLYQRSLQRYYTKRGLVTLAARFAAEVSEKQ